MIYIILFVLWMCFWSFWSVITYRLWQFSLWDIREWKAEFWQSLKSMLVWRSQCPHCHHTLGIWDLLPVISFIVNKWQCAYCKKKIWWTYPLLEIWSGLIFVRVWYFTLWTDMSLTQVWLRIAISRMLYLLMIYDIQKWYLHESIRVWLAILTIWLLSLSQWLLRYYAVQWAAIFLAFFLFIYYFARVYVWYRRKKKEDWFGIGDVWLSPIIWALFGLLQIWFAPVLSMTDWFMLFRQYIVITGLAWLLYAWAQKLFLPQKSIREIPFFPGMIIALWIIMAVM